MKEIVKIIDIWFKDKPKFEVKDFEDWKFHKQCGMLYDPSAVRWLRVILAPDPDTCIDIKETRNKEFKRLQNEYLNQVKQQTI